MENKTRSSVAGVPGHNGPKTPGRKTPGGTRRRSSIFGWSQQSKLDPRPLTDKQYVAHRVSHHARLRQRRVPQDLDPPDLQGLCAHRHLPVQEGGQQPEDRGQDGGGGPPNLQEARSSTPFPSPELTRANVTLVLHQGHQLDTPRVGGRGVPGGGVRGGGGRRRQQETSGDVSRAGEARVRSHRPGRHGQQGIHHHHAAGARHRLGQSRSRASPRQTLQRRRLLWGTEGFRSRSLASRGERQ